MGIDRIIQTYHIRFLLVYFELVDLRYVEQTTQIFGFLAERSPNYVERRLFYFFKERSSADHRILHDWSVFAGVRFRLYKGIFSNVFCIVGAHRYRSVSRLELDSFFCSFRCRLSSGGCFLQMAYQKREI